jgi:hypothetical protein
MINFEYSLDEIVQMDGKGSVSLRTALIHMPDRVGPFGVLYRDIGKIPALFDAEQIQTLIDRHKKELEGWQSGRSPRSRRRRLLAKPARKPLVRGSAIVAN